MRYGGVSNNGSVLLCLIGTYKGEKHAVFQITIPEIEIKQSIIRTDKYKTIPMLVTYPSDYRGGCDFSKKDLQIIFDNNHDGGEVVVGRDSSRPYVEYVRYKYKTLDKLKKIDAPWFIAKTHTAHIKLPVDGKNVYFQVRRAHIDYNEYKCAICLAAMPFTIAFDIVTFPFQVVYVLYKNPPM